MKNFIFLVLVSFASFFPSIVMASVESGLFDDQPECDAYCATTCVQNTDVEAVLTQDCTEYCTDSQCEDDAYVNSSYDAVDSYIINSFLNVQETLMEEEGIPEGDTTTRSTTTGQGSTASATLENPIQASSIPEIIVNVIQVLLTLLGSATLLIFIYGGITLITSAGNEERVKKARATLVWAILGLAIILVSYGVMSFVFGIFSGGE